MFFMNGTYNTYQYKTGFSKLMTTIKNPLVPLVNNNRVSFTSNTNKPMKYYFSRIENKRLDHVSVCCRDSITGNLISKFTTTADIGLLQGEYITWYSNNYMKQLCNYKDGDLEGEFKKWYQDRQIKQVCNYTKDKLNGIYTEWYWNGQERITCIYTHGILHGMYTEWYWNGNLKKRCTYNNGLLDGSFITLHYDGNLHTQYNYINGIRMS